MIKSVMVLDSSCVVQ